MRIEGVDRDAEFSAYAAAKASRLGETAYLICGDWHRAQDLTQLALAKVYVAWHRLHDDGSIDGYAKRILLNEFLSQQRRRSWHERPSAVLPDRPAADDSADLRLTLLEALARLSPRRRAVVVLRYWEDHSVESAADLLGMSASAVKSTSARALAELRELLGDQFPVEA
ncbi:SigE family RNA polymerase sigma factor [Catenulispora subtropica]